MRQFQVDIGNTQAKYRLVSGEKNLANGQCSIRSLQPLLAEYRPTQVLVASVASPEIRQQLADWLVQAEISDVFWAATGTRFGPVQNAYSQHTNLGVDRWLAIIAAYHLYNSACCVFDFGSAVTVDLVNAKGLHLGGYILPGSGLNFAALRQNTAQLNPATELSRSEAPGTGTEDCIRNGIFLQQAAFPHYFLQRLLDPENPLVAELANQRPVIVMTGGGFTQLEAVLPALPYSYQPDLVLDGLQLLASGQWSW